MIINNTNIRGIWSYSDSLVFEEGDFVVKGDQIYICKASGVMGKDPSQAANRDYYTEYPGNMVKSLEEYYDIVHNSSGSDDLYISSRVLNEILQDSYFGLGDSGIIESVIESDGTLHGQIEKLGHPEHVLDSLLVAPDFNNGIVLVSRRFEDVKGLVGLLSFTVDSQDDMLNRVVRIDSTKCIDCGNCVPACPLNAIEQEEAGDAIYVCPNCQHVYTQEEIQYYKEWIAIPYYHGHYPCPHCGAQGAYPEIKTVRNYKINTSICNLCGKCMEACPVVAIYTEEKIDSTVQTEEAEGNQSFSNLISKYQVSDLDYVFVRQYTYKSGATGVLHRIQELVDPDQGLIMFRHAKQSGKNLTMDSTSWQSCLSRDGILIGRELNRIRERINKEETATTTSGFRYRSISFTNRNNNAYFISNSAFPNKTSGIKRVVTLVMELQGKTISSYSTSIDLSDPDEFSGNGKTYYINDEVCFIVKSSTGGFDLDFDVDPLETLILKDVYCREAC